MADFFEWNNVNTFANMSINNFLRVAEKRIEAYPDKLPMRADDGRAAISWLRGLLSRKPSELE